MLRHLGLVALAGFFACVRLANASTVYTIDFETEDDFVTPLVHGQAIYSTARPNSVDPAVSYAGDTVLEFGNLFNVRSTVIGIDGHLGPVIFDTDSTDTLPANTIDDDLLVGLGNVLMLQADEFPATTDDPTYGLVFTTPNDDASFHDRGSLVFDFLVPNVHLISIDLVDVDTGVTMDVILTDVNGKKRTYDVPFAWTTDITLNPAGYQTLDLETLLNQSAEPLATGGDATAIQTAGFDDSQIVRLQVKILGGSPSGAIDNLVFAVVPEPSVVALCSLALLLVVRMPRTI
jgi:hypothetical protein